jgi:glycosyltransferase involved in cell wall biosynthesis
MILNLMLGKWRGGLEQAALDYGEALALASIPALTVVSPYAWLEAPLVAAHVAHQSLTNYRFDPVAPIRLRHIAAKVGARAVLCHGNRALALALRAVKGQVPILAVAHNYSIRRFVHADHCIAITQHLADYLSEHGVGSVSLIPNMVRTHDVADRQAFRTPPVIGSMGRFVPKKGFRNFIEALSILRQRGIAFRAILGGDGKTSARIDALIDRYQLGGQVTRLGWVKDKAAFFESLDVFVLPSSHEPFGIVLTEAMSYALPIVSTNAEGPREIIAHGVNGLLVTRNDPVAMADSLAMLLHDPARATAMGTAAQQRVRDAYSMQAMAHRLQTTLAPYI